MSVVVHAIEEAMGRIGAHRYNQRDGRDEREQTIVAKTLTQDRSHLRTEREA